jgi:UDP-2-acetamido-3-amino-2,3-dideoxy-glucuronate N-acetyltransferase
MSVQFVHPNAVIDPGAQLSPDTILESGCHIGPEVITGAKVRIRAGTQVTGRVTIASNVTVGQGVTIVGPFEIKENVVIGSRSVLGCEVAGTSQLECGFIGIGAHIGKDSIVLGRLFIGPSAHLTPGTRLEGDLPGYGLALGSPAALLHFVCECGQPCRHFETFHLINIARCPFCGKEIRLNRTDFDKARHILLPNGQIGPEMPAWYPPAVPVE